MIIINNNNNDNRVGRDNRASNWKYGAIALIYDEYTMCLFYGKIMLFCFDNIRYGNFSIVLFVFRRAACIIFIVFDYFQILMIYLIEFAMILIITIITIITIIIMQMQLILVIYIVYVDGMCVCFIV